MAGLLDAFNDSGFQRGLLMMAASRPMSEQQRAGLLSYVDNQENAKMQREYMGMQMQAQQAEIEKNRLAASRAAQGQQFMAGLMQRGQPSGVDQQRVGMEGALGFAGPLSPQAEQTAAQMRNPSSWTSQLSLDDAARAKMYGVDLMPIYNAAQQGVTFKPGEVTRLPNGQVVSIAKDGLINSLDGSVREAPGAAAANAAYQGRQTDAVEGAKYPFARALEQDKARIAAQHDLVQGRDQQGNPVFTSRASLLTSAQPGTPQTAIRPGLTNQQSQTNDATLKLNDNWITNTFNPVQAAKGSASDILTQVAVSRNALAAMGGTGWGSETKAMAASVLTSLGIGGKNAEMYATNAQTFNQAAMGRLQTVLNAAKGPQTEGDADRASKTYARLGNTTDANSFILDLMEAQAQRDVMKAQFYEQAMPLARERGDLTEIDREWAKRQPSIFGMQSMRKYAQ